MRKVFITSLILFAVILFPSCSHDNWLEEEPPHLITSETLYTNLDGFESGLNGLYSLVRQERQGRDNSLSEYLTADIAMLGTDNYVPNGRGGFGFIALNWDTRNVSTDSNFSYIFLWLYKVVNAANTIITQAETRTDVDWSGGQGTQMENKNRVIAEAKAIRAWAYRHLTFNWGDVPLNLEESTGSNIKSDWTRTPVNEVRKQMIKDWRAAEPYIGIEPSMQGRISKGAVQHYLSEMYLTLKKPDSALIWADKCINTPNYKLVTERYGVRANQPGVPFMDMFYDGNSNREEGNLEALWVFQFEYNAIGGGGSIMRRYHNGTGANRLVPINGILPLQFTIERGSRGISREAPNKFALDLYESQDDRFSNYAIRHYYTLKTAAENAPAPADELPEGYQYGDKIWLNYENDLTGLANNRVLDYPFVRKWDAAETDIIDLPLTYNDQVYLRISETYLLKAEAQFKLGDAAAAAETINFIRRRANASEITASDITMDFILDERSRN